MIHIGSLAHLQNMAISILGLSFLIILHELGHFLGCLFARVKVVTFSIGFGPTIMQFLYKGTAFRIGAIPFGGYVEPASNTLQGEAHQEARITLPEASYLQKLIIIGAGVAINLAIAFFIFTSIFYKGAPASPLLSPAVDTPAIATINANGLASTIGLQAGDIITKITINDAGHPVAPGEPFVLYLATARKADIATLTIQRKEESKTFTLPQKNAGEYSRKPFGISFALIELPSQSFINSARLALNQIAFLAHSFTLIFTNFSLNTLASPIKIVADGSKIAETGITSFMAYLAIISASLAFLNLIPLPVFDGGQLLIATIEHILKRPLSETVKLIIFGGTWLLLLVIFIMITLQDIYRLFIA